MSKIWIAVANASRARICEQDGPNGLLREVAGFVHPASRQSGTALGAERPGQAHRSLGQATPGGTGLEPRTDAHKKEHERFARELAQVLDDAVATGKAQSLVLVASSPFLGELKARLGPLATKAVSATLAHDLTGLNLRELGARLSESSLAAT